MANDDQNHAVDLDQARAVVREAGAGGLDPRHTRPWQRAGQPVPDGDLVRFAAWVAGDPAADPVVLAAGLRLLGSARAELDQVEASLLFAVRGAGMTWPQIADALGLGSAQAAQQRLNRVLARVSDPATEA